jgi:hypothetical protein
VTFTSPVAGHRGYLAVLGVETQWRGWWIRLS